MIIQAAEFLVEILKSKIIFIVLIYIYNDDYAKLFGKDGNAYAGVGN